MKELFTNDPRIIAEEMNSLVENKVNLICGRRGAKDLTLLTVKGKTTSSASDVLVISHPHEPSCNSPTCVFFYHIKGSLLRCFEVERVKKVDAFLGIKYPASIYNIHRRLHPRVKAGRNSTVTFSVLNKERVHSGIIEDVSVEGVKLKTKLQANLSVGDTLCHLGLALYYRLTASIETRVTIPEAKVVWLKGENGPLRTLGIKFSLPEKYLDAVVNYIDIRSIEDPEDSA